MNRLHQKRLTTYGYQVNDNLTNNVSDICGDGYFTKKLLDNRPKVLYDLLQKEGKRTILKLEVCRTPILSMFEKIINALSFGVTRKKMEERNYDRLFHLYVILYLDNGSTYRIEKNQRLKVVKTPTKGKGTECREVKYGKKMLGAFMTAPEKVNMKNLYRYDAFKENCQNYVRRLLNANGINQFDNFINQKVSDLAPTIVQKIARGFTDIAGVIDYFKQGGGVSKQTKYGLLR
jgi:hypothetical protein